VLSPRASCHPSSLAHEATSQTKVDEMGHSYTSHSRRERDDRRPRRHQNDNGIHILHLLRLVRIIICVHALLPKLFNSDHHDQDQDYHSRPSHTYPAQRQGAGQSRRRRYDERGGSRSRSRPRERDIHGTWDGTTVWGEISEPDSDAEYIRRTRRGEGGWEREREGERERGRFLKHR
jgi:hypothetical protein